MSRKPTPENRSLFTLIRALSNAQQFHIVELTQIESYSIRKLSTLLGLSYTKCADYVALLAGARAISKTRIGREVFIRSTLPLNRLEQVILSARSEPPAR